MKKLFVIFLTTVIFAGCGVAGKVGAGISGSGKIQTAKRDVSDFNSIEFTGNYQGKIVQGNDRSVQIEADDNILSLIKTEVRNNQLIISNEQGFTTKKTPIITITVPNLKEVSATGSNDLDIANIQNDALSIELTGAGKVHCAGQTGNVTIVTSGASSVNAADLHAKSATVQSSGAGSISVFASDSLNVDVSGVGAVDYYGNPKNVKKNVTGIGTLNKKGD